MALDRGTTFTWYGHSCWEVTTPCGKTILFDPWFSNPRSPKKPEAVERCDLLLVSHGHFDHMGTGDAVALAKRLGPTWPCIHELSLYLGDLSLPGEIIGMTFYGRGWGHGVGMCQVGAYGMALDGATYEEILKKYYKGIELKKIY